MSYFTPSGLSVVANAESSGVADTPPYNWAHPGSNSTASGLYGFTDTTWKQYAPQAGVDTSLYPSAYLAPADVQTQVAQITPTSNWTCPGCDANVNAAIAADPTLISSQPSISDGLAAGGVSQMFGGNDFVAVDPNSGFSTGLTTPSGNLDALNNPSVGYIPTGDSSLISGLGTANSPTGFGTGATFDLPGVGDLQQTLTTDAFGNPLAGTSLGTDAFGNALGTATATGSTTDFWTKLFTKIENVGARFGLIAVGIVVIGVGAFAAVHGEFGTGVQKMAKSAI